MFWTFAAALLFAAALFTFLPLLRGNSMWRPFAVVMVFLVPAISAWMYYALVGTPEGIMVWPKKTPPRTVELAVDGPGNASQAAEMDELIASLQARLDENPQNLDGWMLLARSYKATQRFEEAAAALEQARQLDPENPRIIVEQVETGIFLSPDGRISDEAVTQLQQALEAEPTLQKALWLLGIASAQRADVEGATAYWEALLEQLEPGSSVAQSVQAQIDQLKTNTGPIAGTPPGNPATAPASPQAEATPAAAQPSSPAGDVWRGLKVSVRAGDEARNRLPAGGVLYIIVRPDGPAIGPPLGVQRIIDPLLPLDITISDDNSMMQERKISSESAVQMQARLSVTGSPAANAGDWQSQPVAVTLDSTESVELVIDQQIE